MTNASTVGKHDTAFVCRIGFKFSGSDPIQSLTSTVANLSASSEVDLLRTAPTVDRLLKITLHRRMPLSAINDRAATRLHPISFSPEVNLRVPFSDARADVYREVLQRGC